MTINYVVTIKGLEWVGPLFAQLKWRLDHIMATIQERFDAVVELQTQTADKLNEASAEILAELTKLRSGGGFTPEEEASMAKIEANATALATTANTLADTSPPIP